MILKRTLDILASSAGLLLLSPLFAAVMLAIWIEDRRSPFYVAPRLARGGGAFYMLKFRSMTPEAWRSGVNSTAAGDRRITRVGRWLRRAKLDELPQLINVLKGDMSLVGPRPQVAADAALYTREEQAMLSVRPGITDLASIVFADEGEILAGAADPDLLYNQVIRPWKSRLALEYIRARSLAADGRIVALTLLGALSREHALEGVASMLAAWNADALLCRMARRREPLLAWPPPGADQVVAEYPRRSGQAAHA